MTITNSRRTGSLTRRLLLSVAVLGTSAALAGLGTAASWTSAQDVSTGALETGTVAVSVDGGNGFSTPLSALGLGDTIQRTVTLVNSGTLALSQVTLGVAGGSDFASLSPHLALVVQGCSQAWSTVDNLVYTCGGTTSAVASGTLQALAASPATLSNVGLNPGDTSHLRFTLTVDPLAPLNVMGKSTTVSYTVTGVQRAGMPR